MTLVSDLKSGTIFMWDGHTWIRLGPASHKAALVRSGGVGNFTDECADSIVWTPDGCQTHPWLSEEPTAKAWLCFGIHPKTRKVVDVGVFSEPSPTTDLNACRWIPVECRTGTIFGELWKELRVYAHARYPWLHSLMSWDAQGRKIASVYVPSRLPKEDVPTPTVGRIVHFFDDDSEPKPAIVYAVGETGLHLVVFGAYISKPVMIVCDVRHVDDEHTECWWDWPPRGKS